MIDDERPFREIVTEELEIAKTRFPEYTVYVQDEGENSFFMTVLKTQVPFKNREGLRQAMNKAYHTVYRPKRDGEI